MSVSQSEWIVLFLAVTAAEAATIFLLKLTLSEVNPLLPEAFPFFPEAFPLFPETFSFFPETFPSLPEVFLSLPEVCPFSVGPVTPSRELILFFMTCYLDLTQLSKSVAGLPRAARSASGTSGSFTFSK